jgi:hypothetical protein
MLDGMPKMLSFFTPRDSDAKETFLLAFDMLRPLGRLFLLRFKT